MLILLSSSPVFLKAQISFPRQWCYHDGIKCPHVFHNMGNIGRAHGISSHKINEKVLLSNLHADKTSNTYKIKSQTVQNSPSRFVQEADEINCRFALHDSHSILSTSTFIQPLLAQDNELANSKNLKKKKRKNEGERGTKAIKVWCQPRHVHRKDNYLYQAHK